MSNWQLARKPIPFPVRRQYDAPASRHGWLFREVRMGVFAAQQARDTLGVRSGSIAADPSGARVSRFEMVSKAAAR